MTVQDLLWVCDQTFTKTARLVTQELLDNVRNEFQESRKSIQTEVAEPLSEIVHRLEQAMEKFPATLEEPVKRALKQQVGNELTAQRESMSRTEAVLLEKLGAAKDQISSFQDSQTQTRAVCEKIQQRNKERSEDMDKVMSKLQTSVVESSKSLTQLVQSMRQESKTLHDSAGSNLDALLWKHTKETSVNVDFSGLHEHLKNQKHQKSDTDGTAAIGDKLIEHVEEIKSMLFRGSASKDEKDSKEHRGLRRTKSGISGAALSKKHPPVTSVHSDLEKEMTSIEGLHEMGTQTSPVGVSDAEIQTAGDGTRKAQQRKKGNIVKNASSMGSRYSHRPSQVVENKKNTVTQRRASGVFADESAMKKKVRQTLMKKPYSVHDYYHKSGCVQAVAKSSALEYTSLIFTFLNTIWIAIDADYNKAAVLTEAEPIFVITENIFCAYFTLELGIRFCAFRREWDCFKDWWFNIDLAINTYMIAETWVLSAILVSTGASTSMFESFGGGWVIRLIRLVKIFRLSRMARFFRSIPELVIVFKALKAATRSIAVFGLFCGGLIFVFSVMLKQAVEDIDPEDLGTDNNFRSVLHGMNTLLFQGIFHDSSGLANGMAKASPLLWPVALAFILLTSVTLMYMLIGVMVNVIQLVASTEREGMLVSYVAGELRAALEALRYDLQGVITKTMLHEIANEAAVVRILNDCDVDPVVLLDMLDQIYDDHIEKEGHGMTFSDFLDTVLNMRGTNPATVKDIKTSVRSMKTYVGDTIQSVNNTIRLEVGALRKEVEALGIDGESSEEESSPDEDQQ